MLEFKFETDCVSSTGELINEMRDNSVEVSFEEMIDNCVGLLEWSVKAGFELHERLGLTLENDCAVSYHKAAYMGHACYYLVWSCIEHVWVDWDYPIENEDELGEWLAENTAPEMPTDYDRVLAFLGEFVPQLERFSRRIEECRWDPRSESFDIRIVCDGEEDVVAFLFNKDRSFRSIMGYREEWDEAPESL
jgi:hypothetical protein